MWFYYFSLVSWMLWVVYGAIAVTVLSLLWAKLPRFGFRNPIYWILIAALLIAPWGEELWISYNFNQLCRKNAGVFISKTVEVDGYYNDTGKITRLADSPYKFIESRDDRDKFRRVERASEQEKADALAWYRKTNSNEPGEREWFTRPVSEGARVVVEMNTGLAWRITTLDRPSARYHFRSKWSDKALRVGHKVWREETSILDTKTGELIGQYVMYSRRPYWFYIGLGEAPYGCDDSEGGPNTKHSSLIYKRVLIPAK